VVTRLAQPNEPAGVNAPHPRRTRSADDSSATSESGQAAPASAAVAKPASMTTA
jgi:hypothetical protein